MKPKRKLNMEIKKRLKSGRSNTAAKALVDRRLEYIGTLFDLIEEFMPMLHDVLFPDVLDYAHLIQDCDCDNDVERLDCLAKFLEMITPMHQNEYRISVDVLLKLLSKAMKDMYDPFYDDFVRWLEDRYGVKDWQKVSYIDRREVVRYLTGTLFKYLKAANGENRKGEAIAKELSNENKKHYDYDAEEQQV